jgi:hypothetical protein
LVPGLLKFCLPAYGSPSKLQFGDFTVLSREGVQQGDPLGPLLICLAIHPLLSSLNSCLKFGYLHDVTIGGEVDTVSDDVQLVMNGCKDLGLRLNVSKCELISSGQCQLLNPLLSFVQLRPHEATLLGTPLLTGSAMESVIVKFTEDLSRASGRLKLISAHDALIILRSALGRPRLWTSFAALLAPVTPHWCLTTPCSGKRCVPS